MSVGLWLRGWRDLARHYASVAGVAWRDREALEGKRYEAEEAEFLPAALALQQTPISPVPRVLMGLLTTFIVLALLWSILGRTDIVAAAQGKIIPSRGTQVIQPVGLGDASLQQLLLNLRIQLSMRERLQI